MKRNLKVLVAAILWISAPAAQASIFANNTRWPLTPNGYAVIPVCIIEGSSTKQKGDDADAGLIHDTNPSLAAVLYHVKVALAESWVRHSSVRFVGWKDCEDLTDQEREDTVGLYIHPEASNKSMIGRGARGRTSRDDRGTQFQPWGAEFNRCIGYNWETTHVEYSYDCAEQYAIHEFGHAIGFIHEWFHPSTPQECQDFKRKEAEEDGEEYEIITSSYATVYDPRDTYTIVNLQDYDWNSIMVYDDSLCAHVTGVRFGSKNLSAWDKSGVVEVYPPVTHGRFDVGVVPEDGGCRDSEPIAIYMDDEDSDNESDAEGWVGASHVDRNTTLEFCRVDGSLFGKMAPAPSDLRTGDYAVLKLGDVCPDGSVEITRHFDNEDDNNENYYSGDIAPNGQDRNTTLGFCLFRPENAGGTEISALPQLSYAYGVIARDFVTAVDAGKIHTDDEDSDNDNRLSAPDEARQSAERIIASDRNTDLYIAKVSDVGVSGIRGESGWFTSGVTVTLNARGAAAIQFNLDGSGNQVYSGPFTINSNGSHELYYYYHVVGEYGNLVETVREVTIPIDTAAPAMSGRASPAANAFGWNNSDVTVRFTATDEVSGVASVSPDVALSAEGAEQSVAATASDVAGNTARFTLGGIRIDKTRPAVTYSGNLGSYQADATIDIACSASDALSGVATHTCSPVQGPAYLFLPGANSFSATATDWAGNIGSGTTSFTVVATYDSVQNVVARLCSDPGVVNGLAAKLNAAQAAQARGNLTAKANQIQAFINQVNAQAGKSLTPENAAILIRLAKAL